VDTLRYDPPEGWDAADYVREMQRMPLGDEQIRAELQAVIATASVAPRKWLCGVDLDDCCAAARLADASTFQPKRFIPTGYSQLDKALGGGWYEGEATTLFAPSSMGKSSVMLNLAVAAARQGIPTAVLSLEMRGSDVLQLATSIVADLPRLHVRCGTMTANENEKMQAAIAELSQWPLYVVDRSRFPVDPQHPEAPTMQAVADVMREGVTRCGWRLVILDYLTKVGPFGDDDLTRYPKLTNWAFDLAQRLGIHFICLAQTGKSSWGRKDENGGRSISLEDCKGSIEVIADFDNAIGLVRDDWNSEAPEDSPLLRAVVLKARQAAGGVCQLVFHRLTGRVEEVTPEQQAAPDLRAHVGSHRQSPEESAALLEKCIPAIPAPRAVILLSAEEHGIPASRATALLSRAIHERRAFKARVNGEYLYANNSEAFEQILTAEAATEKEEA
jgi:RecA/RadA recombinase